jgi:hypothetical protein
MRPIFFFALGCLTLAACGPADLDALDAPAHHPASLDPDDPSGGSERCLVCNGCFFLPEGLLAYEIPPEEGLDDASTLTLFVPGNGDGPSYQCDFIGSAGDQRVTPICPEVPSWSGAQLFFPSGEGWKYFDLTLSDTKEKGPQDPWETLDSQG